ncbi:ABC transporter permease [Alkalilimnicola ehrlichii MLHE-1]|uniref:Binding-protein-dependent transport systems inner membrane component n=1 Tax=Alkalilimnicola ehrlichii (strain ATCC BAA-1101 / DSM 17681 / MLHE-1) TaxID=187272 RepID=Q0A9Q0_ALKEH|nr:ABC transporter permease [Alkalilimnicola ehrlichii]ABI56437.1 binding-protein-dependent transport systems inner membrane component [Alkalilimnicola ehrlichii MLHE-1]
MLRYTLRRLLMLGLTLVVASLLVFALTTVLPGDVGRIMLGPFADEAAVAQVNRELGLDQPVVQRYLDWVGGVLRGDWGHSYTLEAPVLPLALERLGRSLLLAGLALALLIPTALAAAVVAGRRAGGWLDRTGSITALVLSAMPEFVTGVLLIMVFGVMLGWLPVQALPPEGSGLPETLRHLLMPALSLALLLFAYLFRMARDGMITELRADYTRTAVLKGLPPGVVIRRHVLRNALLPTVTVIGAQVGWLVGGLVVVESLFRYPGIGGLIHGAALDKDIPLLAGCALLITLVYALANMLADLVYAALNPKVRRGMGGR